jgi:hypothetical protein
MASTSTPSQQSMQSHIDAASSHANPTWKEAALAATMRLASRQQRFTSFDVLQELAKSDVTTHDLRAIGGVMREARELGLITGFLPAYRCRVFRNPPSIALRARPPHHLD